MTSRRAPVFTSYKRKESISDAESLRHLRLAAAIDDYYTALDAGEMPNRQQLLDQYSDVADELAECLTSLDFIQNVAPQLAGDAGDQRAANRTTTAAPANLGDFRLMREIGRGGMGVVYEAEQLSLGRRVAVKVLLFAAMLDERQLARFKNEARAAASLQHPHIVPVYYVGVERGVHYFAMQYIEGQSLAQIIAKAVQGAPGGAQRFDQTKAIVSADAELHYPPSAPAAETRPLAAAATLTDPASPARFRAIAELGIQAATALHHAHESGVIHRDVKPSNLLVDYAGKLWVADFGLARINADPAVTLTGDLVGTLRYMSPEQLLGKAAMVDHRTDVYSLGLTLYELQTGRPAFRGDNSEQLMRQILETEPPAPRTVNRALPADLETIVLKAIRKDAADRYATAQDLADDLQRYLDAKPIVARRPTLVDRAAMWTRRHTGVALAVGAGLLAAALVAVVAALLIGRASRERAAALQQADERLSFARRVVDDMYTKVAEGWLATQPRMTPLQAEFLEKAAEFYREVAAQTAGDAQSETDAALAAWRVATISINQGRLADAEPLLRNALGQLDATLRAAPADPERQHRRALIAMSLATVVGERGNPREAAKLNAEAGAAWSDLARRFPEEPKYVARQADIWQNLGTSLAVPEPAAAEPRLRQAIAGYEQALAADYQPSQTHVDLARTRINLAVALDNLHRHDEANTELIAALAHIDESCPVATAAPDIRALAAGAWYQLARQHRHLEQDDDARRAIEQSIALGQRLVEEFPDRPVYQQHLNGAITLQKNSHKGPRPVVAVRAPRTNKPSNDAPQTKQPHSATPIPTHRPTPLTDRDHRSRLYDPTCNYSSFALEPPMITALRSYWFAAFVAAAGFTTVAPAYAEDWEPTPDGAGVIDHDAGLVWGALHSSFGGSGSVDWATAEAGCRQYGLKAFNVTGQYTTGWRMPTLAEAQKAASHNGWHYFNLAWGEGDPACWTSTAQKKDYWALRFMTGATGLLADKKGRADFRPVRPRESWTYREDLGGWLDNQTGLVWGRSYVDLTGSNVSWNYATTSAIANYRQLTGNPAWRLPTLAEAETAGEHNAIAYLSQTAVQSVNSGWTSTAGKNKKETYRFVFRTGVAEVVEALHKKSCQAARSASYQALLSQLLVQAC